MVVNSKIRDSDWLTFALTIVNFNYVFIQPAPGKLRHAPWLNIRFKWLEQSLQLTRQIVNDDSKVCQQIKQVVSDVTDQKL